MSNVSWKCYIQPMCLFCMYDFKIFAKTSMSAFENALENPIKFTKYMIKDAQLNFMQF